MGSRHCAIPVCCSMGGSICSSFDRNGNFGVIIKGSRKTAFFTLKIPVRYDILSFDQNRGQEIVQYEYDVPKSQNEKTG